MGSSHCAATGLQDYSLSNADMNSIKLFTGNSNPELARLVSKRLGIPLANCKVTKFANQETSVTVGESVRE